MREKRRICPWQEHALELTNGTISKWREVKVAGPSFDASDNVRERRI
jgi:hypothetical protein